MRYILIIISLLFALSHASAQQINEIKPIKAAHSPQSLKQISLRECIETGLE